MPTDYELIRETLIEDCHELLEGAQAVHALDRLKASMDATSKAASDNAALAERYRVALMQVMHRHERTDEVTEMICKRALYPETFPSE